MKVLILSCNTGQGHNTAGKAILETFTARGVDCTMMDTLRLAGEDVSRKVSGAYCGLTTHFPRGFGWLYKAGSAISNDRVKSPVYYANTTYARHLLEVIHEGGYDRVVMPHLFPAEALTWLRRRGDLDVLTYVVGTDYTCIPFWEETEMDHYLIPHKDLVAEFVKKGVPEEKLVPTGIPVSARFRTHASKEEAMQAAIRAAGSEGDSVGGILETIVTGLPAGIGEPWFDSVESELAHLMFAIPACKGIEFGAGFGFAAMHGSQANDPFTMRDGKIATATNKNGGINGGITNGMPIVFRTVLKPTPSIYKQQHTVDYISRTDAELQIKGRHDPCIVPRAAVVQNSLTAFGLLDLLTVRYGTLAQKHGFPKV